MVLAKAGPVPFFCWGKLETRVMAMKDKMALVLEENVLQNKVAGK